MTNAEVDKAWHLLPAPDLEQKTRLAALKHRFCTPTIIKGRSFTVPKPN